MPSIIRLATEHDAEQVQAIYTPIVVNSVISFEVDPPSVEELRRRISDTLISFPWLVCESGGEVLGYAYAGRHRSRAAYQWSVDVSAYTRESARRRGVARALYSSLFEILALQGFTTAYAGIALPNPASIGLHESLGFRPIGVYHKVGFKLGAWHDVGWWELELQAYPSSPTPPSDLAGVLESGGWNEALKTGMSFLRS